jgi:hypothetical protein
MNKMKFECSREEERDEPNGMDRVVGGVEGRGGRQILLEGKGRIIDTKGLRGMSYGGNEKESRSRDDEGVELLVVERSYRL